MLMECPGMKAGAFYPELAQVGKAVKMRSCMVLPFGAEGLRPPRRRAQPGMWTQRSRRRCVIDGFPRGRWSASP
jgi:hypothetical protein